MSQTPEELARWLFSALEAGRWDEVVDSIHPLVLHSFAGDTRGLSNADANEVVTRERSNAGPTWLEPRTLALQYFTARANEQTRSIHRTYLSTYPLGPADAEVEYAVRADAGGEPYTTMRLQLRRDGARWYLNDFMSLGGIPLRIVAQGQTGLSFGID